MTLSDNEQLNRIIADEVRRQLSSSLFTTRKLSDTPTDNLQLTPMSYVNRYFATAYRPTPTKIGEHYFDTTKGNPLS